jgi:phage tail sheath protein FI
MVGYRTPGVYFEISDEPSRSIEILRTDIAAFVGIASRGRLHEPRRVESWTQFVSEFGGHTPQGNLAYAVEGFFDNGGQTCWVVRVADPEAAKPAHVELVDVAGKPHLRLSATTPGTWAHDVEVVLRPHEDDRFSLMLESPAQGREYWTDLSLDPEDPRFVAALVNDPVAGSALVRADSGASPDGPDPATLSLLGGSCRLAGGADGLQSLGPHHFTGEPEQPGQASARTPRGLATLETIDEVSIVAIPDAVQAPPPPPQPPPVPPRPGCETLHTEPDRPIVASPFRESPPHFDDDQLWRVQRAMVAQCERLKDRIALLDPRYEDAQPQAPPERVIEWRRRFDSAYAALSFPWLHVPTRDPLAAGGTLRAVPPSGHVAGIYARVDRESGVHCPPANRQVRSVGELSAPIGDVAHGDLNAAHVNVLRAYSGRGIRVAGARTLAATDRSGFRFVNVRRLVSMIEEAVDEGIQWAVFEPNSRDSWRDVDRVVRSFLDGLWRRGMLDGATAEDAYFVRCDETTNPAEAIEAGRMTCLVGVQPPWPAEFVVVRIGKTEGGMEITESEGRRIG